MERRAIVVRGIVQGVGFRPFVYNLATRLGLGGFVKNQTGTLHIEIEGEPPALEQFLSELAGHPPPLAQIEHLAWEAMPTRADGVFRIEASEADAATPIFISPDVATCDDCLHELFDPADRRYRYPFLNCTNCGPRLTIITGTPYDRPQTTMAGFPMCDACRAEYDDPTNRRFHAQPTACAACGPRLELLDASGQRVETADPLESFLAALLDGKIGAMKGLGGYHLVCDARSQTAVSELRRRKHRDEKPFAVMVADVAGAEALAEVGPQERELLLSPRRPIVLLRKRRECDPSLTKGVTAEVMPVSPPGPSFPRGEEDGVADDVAPGNPHLGVMLPYTPLHNLLLRTAGVPLVMTSGNRSDEPIAYRDPEALENLRGIADLFLIHNRPIHVRCDDSVTRSVDGLELPVRRSRGYAPRPVALPLTCPAPILAVGGQLKGTFALGRGRQAFLSHHLGDLDHFQAYQAFLKDVALYGELLGVVPAVLVHDLHPDYATTHYAQQRATREGIAVRTVQHHHAHMASCMAENGLNEPVIGVSFDGTGYGTDGAIWGGEFLVGDYRKFHRAAHLRYVGLPGGDRAIHEPWRMAASHLTDAGIPCESLLARFLPGNLPILLRMLERSIQTPLTSSMGRLFDAVASLAGVRDHASYEGQAAIELEWLASRIAPAGEYPFGIANCGLRSADAASQTGQWNARPSMTVDTRPLIAAVAADVQRGFDAGLIGRRFHSTVVSMIALVCGRLRETTGIATVVLSGGVFLNALLTTEAMARLRSDGFRAYRHRLVPPNDGGLSLGQLAVAAALMAGQD